MPASFTSEPDNRYPLLLTSLKEDSLSEHQLSEFSETRSGKHSLDIARWRSNDTGPEKPAFFSLASPTNGDTRPCPTITATLIVDSSLSYFHGHLYPHSFRQLLPWLALRHHIPRTQRSDAPQFHMLDH